MMLVPAPTNSDPLIESIYALIEAEAAKELPRGYIGASSIGEKCERKLYYKYRNPLEAAPRKAELILAANDGHRSEDLAASYIRKISGITLITHHDDGTQYGFSDLGGEYKGHVDGIILGMPQAPKTWHIWENKCCNEKKFAKLLAAIEKYGSKGALEAWDERYYAQAVTNMHYFEITRHYTTVWLAGTRKLITLRTEENKSLAAKLKAKAQRIINYESPPLGISDNPAWYECKMCEFNEFCHK